MNADGSDKRQLTYNKENETDVEADWQPICVEPVGGELLSPSLLSVSSVIIAIVVAVSGYSIIGKKKLQ